MTNSAGLSACTGAAVQHEVDRGVRLGRCHGHHHALARGQSIGLDHNRRTLGVDVSVRRRGVGEALVVGRRDVVPLHEGFGKCLGAFKLRGSLRRAKNAQPVGAEFIDHAGRQRRLRTDHGQLDFFLLRPFAQGFDVGDRHRLIAHVVGRRAVARRHINLVHPAGLGQAPGQRVFAAATADDENFHAAAFIRNLRPTRRCDKSPGRRPGLPARQVVFACAPRRRRSRRRCSRRAS